MSIYKSFQKQLRLIFVIFKYQKRICVYMCNIDNVNAFYGSNGSFIQSNFFFLGEGGGVEGMHWVAYVCRNL